MVQRTGNSNDEEPEQRKYELPSEKEHLFQVTDVIEDIDPDPDIVHVKCEVCGGDEEGRTLLCRLSLDDNFKGFFATRLFLKAISEPYKGKEFAIDTEEWSGRQFYATVIHNGKYANIEEYNFDKIVQQKSIAGGEDGKKPTKEEAIAWDE